MPTLSDVNTWLYHLADVNGATADRIGASNADLVITEWASYAAEEAPYTPAQLDRMRGDNADRLIVSYLSIGEAETYRFYWDRDWQTDAPTWLGDENPEWEGNLKVRFWDPGWQAIVVEYLDRIIDAGFNGIYMDIIDAFEYWAGENPVPGMNYAQEMADFVALLQEHAAERIAATDPGRDFFLIGQNGLELIVNPTYRDAVDGIGVEDLRFYYRNGEPDQFGPQRASDYAYTLGLIAQAEAAGAEAFVIEYLPRGVLPDAEGLLADAADDLGRLDVPLYVSNDRGLMNIDLQPLAIENGDLPGFGPASTLAILGQNFGEYLGGTRRDDIILAGGGIDRLLGWRGDDTLRGGRGADRLHGGRGDDTLDGGRGDDRLNGGAGADLFQFRREPGHDVIRGFDVTQDRILLPGSVDHSVVNTEFGVEIRFGRSSVILIALDAADLTDAVFL